LEPIIAIIYDCDGTLARDTTYFLLDHYGVDSDKFWVEVAKEVERGWDPPLAYLEGILKLVREGAIADLTAKKLREIGASVEMFPGLPEMFAELDQVLANQSQLKDAVIKLEHYLVSGGIGDLLRGLKVAPHMTEIFGCEFDFDLGSGASRGR
jgi:hypothetical protein